MSDREVFRLQNELEDLKQRRGMRIPSFTPLLAFLIMVGGIMLTLFGLPELGYRIGLLGFTGFAVIYMVQNYLRRREHDIEYRIQEAERKLEELKHY